jgi:hypothetical protein
MTKTNIALQRDGRQGEMEKSRTAHEESFSGWLVFISLTAVLLLCYVPVLVTQYAFSDDYSVLATDHRGKIELERETKISQGRPTHALLIELFFHNRNIGNLRYLRLLSVAGIVLLAWSLYRRLLGAEWSSKVSFVVALIVCTLPPFQVYASWGVEAFFPFAALASGGALSLAERAFHERRPFCTLGLAAGAVLVLLLALTIYQPAAMFFWVFAAIVLFKPGASLSSVLHRFLLYCVIAFTALLLGFSIYKLGSAMYAYMLSPLRSHLSQDIGEKALWFFREPITNALNLVKLSPKRWLAISVGVFMLGGLTLYLEGTAKERFCKGTIALSIVPLSYLPNLVIAENWSSYRTLSALTSVIVIYILFAIWGYGRVLGRSLPAAILTVGLSLAALTSSLLAAYNVAVYFALPQYAELQWLRGYLAEQDLSQAHSLYIIRSSWQDSIAPTVRYDEFGTPSSYPPWSSGSMVYLLLYEMNPEHANLPIEVTPNDGPDKPPADALIIDMRKISSLR